MKTKELPVNNNHKMSQIAGRQIARINDKISKLAKDKQDIMNSCPHYGLIATPGADTGNWCKADDQYWYDYECPYCGKWWRVYDKD